MRRRHPRSRLHSEDGAATIEALGLILVLIVLIPLTLFIGIGFHNKTLLNILAGNASLTAQTQVGRYGNPSDNSLALFRADQAVNDVLANEENRAGLISVPSISYQLRQQVPQAAPRASVLPNGNPMPQGWLWSAVDVRATMDLGLPYPFGSTLMAGRSVTPSFQVMGANP